MTIQEDILDEFCKRLVEVDGFTQEMVAQLCEILKTGKKPKTDDLANILTSRPRRTPL